MAYADLAVHIKGILPALQHNGRMADPSYVWTKRLKAITEKKKKTDEDIERQYETEFKGSLYMKDPEAGETVVWPSDNVHAMLVDAAKKTRQRPKASIGILVRDDYPLIYKGPTNRDELWLDEKFRFIVGVRLRGLTRVMRSRPRFMEWQFKCVTSYLPEILSKSDVVKFWETAAREIGLSEWHGRYGLFEILDITNGGSVS